MATLLKVLNNPADIKSAGGVALRLRTQAPPRSVAGLARSARSPSLDEAHAGLASARKSRVVSEDGRSLSRNLPPRVRGRLTPGSPTRSVAKAQAATPIIRRSKKRRRPNNGRGSTRCADRSRHPAERHGASGFRCFLHQVDVRIDVKVSSIESSNDLAV